MKNRRIWFVVLILSLFATITVGCISPFRPMPTPMLTMVDLRIGVVKSESPSECEKISDDLISILDKNGLKPKLIEFEKKEALQNGFIFDAIDVTFCYIEISDSVETNLWIDSNGNESDFSTDVGLEDRVLRCLYDFLFDFSSSQWSIEDGTKKLNAKCVNR